MILDGDLRQWLAHSRNKLFGFRSERALKKGLLGGRTEFAYIPRSHSFSNRNDTP